MPAFGDSIGHAKELKLPPSETDADDDKKSDPSWTGMVIIATNFFTIYCDGTMMM